MKNLFFSILFLTVAAGAMAQGRFTSFGTPDEQLARTYDIRLFKGVDGVWFDLQDDNSTPGALACPNILDWLQGRVAGLQVYHYRDLAIPFLRTRPASVFVDEMRVDYSFLNALSTADIALVKVMPNSATAATGTLGGAIAIYIRRGEAGEEGEN